MDFDLYGMNSNDVPPLLGGICVWTKASNLRRARLRFFRREILRVIVSLRYALSRSSRMNVEFDVPSIEDLLIIRRRIVAATAISQFSLRSRSSCLLRSKVPVKLNSQFEDPARRSKNEERKLV